MNFPSSIENRTNLTVDGSKRVGGGDTDSQGCCRRVTLGSGSPIFYLNTCKYCILCARHSLVFRIKLKVQKLWISYIERGFIQLFFLTSCNKLVECLKDERNREIQLKLIYTTMIYKRDGEENNGKHSET